LRHIVDVVLVATYSTAREGRREGGKEGRRGGRGKE
jgi:hypothetical protein